MTVKYLCREVCQSQKGSYLTDNLIKPQAFIFSGGFVYRKTHCPIKKKIRLDNYLQCQWCGDSLIALNHSTFNETHPVQFCPFAKNLPIQVQAAQVSVTNSLFSDSNPLYSHLLQVSDPCPYTHVGSEADARTGFSFLSRH